MKRSGDPVIGNALNSCHPERGRVESCETSASRRIPAMPIPEHAISGSSYETSPIWHVFTTETRRHGEDQEGLLEIDCSPKALAAEFPDNPITCDHPITRSARRSHETLKDLLTRLTSAIGTLFAALREIFDESAYDRFLVRTNEGRSIASYRAFIRERDAAISKKPRCC